MTNYIKPIAMLCVTYIATHSPIANDMTSSLILCAAIMASIPFSSNNK